jgi:squalene-associated FAD-dependent desaturase
VPKVIIVGGGLAGLSAAAALGSAGFEVDLLESRAFFGGRATSWPVPGEGETEVIDNCQHVLLKCCVNLQDFYKRLGVEDEIQYFDRFYFIEPGGRVSVMKRGVFPAPAHFTESFLTMKCFSMGDKLSIFRAMMAIPKERHRKDRDDITMLDWLRSKGQTRGALERYWKPVLYSAISEELDGMAAAHAFQVFWLGMFASRDAYELGVPTVPLRELYRADMWSRLGSVALRGRAAAEQIVFEKGRVAGVLTGGEVQSADYYISALPFEKLAQVAPGAPVDTSPFRHSPITGIHLWFDRSVTTLPHATLLDRTIQWMFNKHEGRYVQIVVSASRSLVEMPRQAVIDLVVRELAEFFPGVREAKLERAQVIKEVRAIFSAVPGLESKRPVATTTAPNFFLAGDWTKTGWPATMEGAVRSGYLAAEAVARAAGQTRTFLIPDIG